VIDSRQDLEKKVSVSHPQADASSRDPLAPIGVANDTGAPVVAPSNDTSAPAAMHHEPAAPRDVPPSHQMLDSAPVAPSVSPVPHTTSELASEIQMRVGIRTSAFGAVEIYTSVHQNSVGLAVHGERGLSHWFGTEVQNIESGLKDHHLNLTTVELDGGAGLHTSTGSHHQQPRHSFYASSNWHRIPDAEIDSPELIEIATPNLLALSAETRVSIHI
jgi:hypothetical protein